VVFVVYLVRCRCLVYELDDYDRHKYDQTCINYNMWIRRHNTTDICENFDSLSLKGFTNCSRGRITPTATDCRYLTVLCLPLESGDYKYIVYFQYTFHSLLMDMFDFCLGIIIIINKPRLCPSQGHCRNMMLLQVIRQ